MQKVTSKFFKVALTLWLAPLYLSCVKDAPQADPQQQEEKKDDPQDKPEKDPVFQLSVTGKVNIPFQASSLQVTVTTNLGGFEPYCEAAWVHIQEKTDDSFTLSFDENINTSSRSVNVWVAAPSRASMKDLLSFSVTQAAHEIDYTEQAIDGNGTSNCYLLPGAGLFSFSATVKGNGKGCEGLNSPSTLNPKGVVLVWQGVKGFIGSLSLKNGRILAKVDKTAANAVIAATDASGNIIWSWHLWCPGFEIEEKPVIDGSIMDVNLGATSRDFKNSVNTYGLMYQWGRKDPFPGSPIRNNGDIYTLNAKVYDINGNEVKIGSTSMYNTLNNNLAFSIANPATCISCNAQKSTTGDWLKPSESNGAFWGNPKGYIKPAEGEPAPEGTKTYYDPCPVGWRVPSANKFKHITESGGYSWAAGETEGELIFYDLGGEAYFAAVDLNADGYKNLLDYTDGWWFYTHPEKQDYSYFPATTRYDGSYAMFMGSMVGLWGNYWYNNPSDPENPGRSMALSFGIKNYSQEYEITASPASNGYRADAYPVRCMKE